MNFKLQFAVVSPPLSRSLREKTNKQGKHTRGDDETRRSFMLMSFLSVERGIAMGKQFHFHLSRVDPFDGFCRFLKPSIRNWS
jgi:hypothetical protein